MIIKSYCWYIACIIDKLCYDFASFDDLPGIDYDEILFLGCLKPIHYSLFCTSTNNGRLLHFLYSFCTESLFFIENLCDLYDCLKLMKPLFESIDKFCNSKKIKANYRHLYFQIEQLQNPVNVPHQFPHDVLFIESHFFRDHNEFLDFNKDEIGNWIEADGFFIGISYFFYCCLPPKQFNQYIIEINKNKFPAKNFSQDDDGLFRPHPLAINPEIHEDKTPNGQVELISTEQGVFPFYKMVHKKQKKFDKIFDLLFNFFDKNSPELINDDENHKILLNQEEIRDFITIIENLPNFIENITYFKVFKYKTIIPLCTSDAIHANCLFEILSQGIIKRAEKRKLPQAEIVILQSFEEDIEK